MKTMVIFNILLENESDQNVKIGHTDEPILCPSKIKKKLDNSLFFPLNKLPLNYIPISPLKPKALEI